LKAMEVANSSGLRGGDNREALPTRRIRGHPVYCVRGRLP
jgi:hypothetical protein